jgi:hypothetical protein
LLTSGRHLRFSITFEQITFAKPTASLTVQIGASALFGEELPILSRDQLTVNDIALPGVNLIIDGQVGADEIILAGTVTVRDLTITAETTRVTGNLTARNITVTAIAGGDAAGDGETTGGLIFDQHRHHRRGRAVRRGRQATRSLGVAELTGKEAERLLDAARLIWVRSGLVGAEQLAAAREVTLAAADLPALMLGNADGTGILLDVDAARHGWQGRRGRHRVVARLEPGAVTEG